MFGTAKVFTKLKVAVFVGEWILYNLRSSSLFKLSLFLISYFFLRLSLFRKSFPLLFMVVFTYLYLYKMHDERCMIFCY